MALQLLVDVPGATEAISRVLLRCPVSCSIEREGRASIDGQTDGNCRQ